MQLFFSIHLWQISYSNMWVKYMKNNSIIIYDENLLFSLV